MVQKTNTNAGDFYALLLGVTDDYGCEPPATDTELTRPWRWVVEGVRGREFPRGSDWLILKRLNKLENINLSKVRPGLVQALREAVGKYWIGVGHGGEYVSNLEHVERILETLRKSVVEAERGRWVYKSSDDILPCRLICRLICRIVAG